MHGRRQPPGRWSRAAVCGVVGVSVGLGLHHLASGPIHSLAGVLAALALSVVLSAAVLEQEASSVRIWSLLAVTQLFTHVFAGAHQQTTHAAHSASASAESAGVAVSGRMLLAHLVATVVMAWWLRDLERLAWRLVAYAVRRVVDRLAPAAAPAPMLPGRARVRPSSGVATAVSELLTSTTRRGPPVPAGISL